MPPHLIALLPNPVVLLVLLLVFSADDAEEEEVGWLSEGLMERAERSCDSTCTL